MMHYRELAIFCRNMSSALHAGFDLERALDVVREEAESPRIKAAVKSTSDGLRSGKSLSLAMRSAEEIYTKELISAIAVTEQTGQLELAFSGLSERFDRSDDTVRRILRAALYPVIVLIILIAAVLIVAAFYHRFLAALGTIGGILMILILLFWLFDHFKRAGTETDAAGKVLMHLPIVGTLILKAEMADLAGNLAIFYDCGCLPDRALRLSAGSLRTEHIRIRVLQAAELVEKGNALSDALSEAGVFPPVLINSIRTGEISGNMDGMLRTVERYYRDDVRNSVDRLFAALRQ